MVAEPQCLSDKPLLSMVIGNSYGSACQGISCSRIRSTAYCIAEDYTVKNGASTKYIFAGTMRLAVLAGSEGYYFHKDHSGSSTAMTNQSGAKVESSDYMPFGHLREHTGSTISNYKFTDQELDPESGLYNYDARLYDPVIGRFISPDTMVKEPFNPQNLNRYSYCLNNPLIYVDPTGQYQDDYGGIDMGDDDDLDLSSAHGNGGWNGNPSGGLQGDYGGVNMGGGEDLSNSGTKGGWNNDWDKKGYEEHVKSTYTSYSLPEDKSILSGVIEGLAKIGREIRNSFISAWRDLYNARNEIAVATKQAALTVAGTTALVGGQAVAALSAAFAPEVYASAMVFAGTPVGQSLISRMNKVNTGSPPFGAIVDAFDRTYEITKESIERW